MSLYNVMYYTYVKPPNVCLPRCRHSCCCPDIFSKLCRWTPALRGVLVSVPNAPSSSFVHRCTHARECYYSADVEYMHVPRARVFCIFVVAARGAREVLSYQGGPDNITCVQYLLIQRLSAIHFVIDLVLPVVCDRRCFLVVYERRD